VTHPALSRLRAPLLVLMVAAVLAVAAAGFVAAGSLVPPIALVLGAAAALGLAALAFGPLGQPHYAPFMAAAALLVAALAGMVVGSAASDAATPGAMSAAELAARCTTVALGVALLAALCPLPVAARGLAGAALGAPALFVLAWIQAAVLPGLDGGAVGLAVAGLVVLLLLLLAGWARYLRQSRALELVHESLGRRAVPAVLQLGTTEQIDTALALLDGWLDPLGVANEQAQRLASAAAGEPRRLALNALQAAVAPVSGVLSHATRETLEEVAGAVPEANVALAVDALVRRSEQASTLLDTVERALLAGTLVQVADPLVTLLAARPADPVSAFQRVRLDDAAIVGEFAAGDRATALQHSFVLLERRTSALGEPARAALAEHAAQRPEAFLLLAEDDVRREQPVDALVAIGHALRTTAASEHWLPAEGLRAWERHGALATLDVLRALWERARGEQNGAASLALALAALELGLPRDLRAEVDRTGGDTAALVAALDELRQGRLAPQLTRLVTRADLLPPAVLAERVLPRLDIALADFEMPQFFRRDARPQLLEVLEAPPTSIYGGRVTVWLAERGSRVVRLAVTGSGPAAVAARVATILGELASERGCATDLLLAGAAFFDLTDPAATPQRKWSEEEFEQRVLDRADELGVTSDIRASLGETPGRELLAAFAAQPPSITADGAHEALARAAGEMGFIELRSIDAAMQGEAQIALMFGATARTPSIPVLAPYRVGREPLRVRIPAAFAGRAELDVVAEEYRLALLAEIRTTWERHQRTYRGWAEATAKELKALREELKRDGAQALATRTLQIGTYIDLDTLTETAADPPLLTTALEQMERLPDLLMRELAFLARAEEHLERLPEDFAPQWALATVVDACLRGCELPFDTPHLRTARAAWESRQRAAATLALQQALAAQGVTLRDIAVENTVFRLAARDDAGLELELLHVFDPHYDIAPPATAPASIFQPRWGSRHRTLMASAEAEEVARDTIARALQNRPLAPGALRVLAWDSGAALDTLLAAITRPLESRTLKRDLEQAVELVATRPDPFAAFFDEPQRSLPPMVQARRAGDEGRVVGAVPDLLAFEIYVAGQVLQAWAKAEVKEDSGSEGVRALAAMGPWQIVNELASEGEHAYAVRQGLAASPQNRPPGGDAKAPQLVDAARLKESVELLKRRAPEYARQAFAGRGFPPSSPLRKQRSRTGALHHHLHAAYHIAEGDAALQVVSVAQPGLPADRERLDNLVARLKEMNIPASLTRPLASRDALVEQLVPLQGKDDRASLAASADALRQARLAAFQHADSAYRQATLIDTQAGDAWLRLVRLKWLMGHYAEALRLLVGPPPAPVLAACQLPLGVAVAAAGGELTIEPGDVPWRGAEGLRAESEANDGVSALVFRDGASLVGSCTVEKLGVADAKLLAELFARHTPAQLNERPAASFEEWLRLTPVPSLGLRGELAQAIAGEQGLVLLAAMVYLGAPAAISTLPGVEAPRRPDAWRQEQVVRQVAWLARTARTA
jgi:hypothetical protein